MNFYPLKAYIPLSNKIKNPFLFIASIKDSFLKGLEEGSYYYFDQCFFYLYTIRRQDFESISVVALVDPHSYESGIKPHESTILSKKNVIYDTILKERVITKPIMTFCDDQTLGMALSNIKKEASRLISLNLGVEGVHEIYQVKKSDSVDSLVQKLSGISHLFVADGHHRLDSIYRIYENLDKNVKILVSIFPKEMLFVTGFNREFLTTPEFDKRDVLDQLNSHGILIKSNKEKLLTQRSSIYVRIENEYYEFVLKEVPYMEGRPRIASEILDEIFKLHTINLQPSAPSLTDPFYDQEHKDKIIFFLPPISMDTIISETVSGRLLPPKCTWFEPKVRSGLIVGKVFE